MRDSPGAAAHPVGRQRLPRRRRRGSLPTSTQRHATTAGATPAELADAYRKRCSRATATAWSPCTSRPRCRAPTVRRCRRHVSSAPRCGSSTPGRRPWASASSRWRPRRQAAAGADLNAVEAAARSAVPRGHAFIVVHRLDNLRRSGRIRRGASLVGYRAGAEAAVVSRCRRQAGACPTDPHRHQGACGDDRSGRRGGRRRQRDDRGAPRRQPDAADDIAETLTVRLPQIAPPTVTDMGPVLAVHVGAGAVGVCVTVTGLVTMRWNWPATNARSSPTSSRADAATVGQPDAVRGVVGSRRRRALRSASRA